MIKVVLGKGDMHVLKGGIWSCPEKGDTKLSIKYDNMLNGGLNDNTQKV